MVQASRIRKNRELSLILLAALLAPAGLQALTPVQMVVFTLVAMFYIPFVATISALVKEFGGKKALFITCLK